MRTTCPDATRELRMVFKGLSAKKNIWERCMRPTKPEVLILSGLL